MKKRSKKTSVWGWILAVFCGLGAISFISTLFSGGGLEGGPFVLSLIGTAGGVLLIRKGWQTKKRYAEFAKYVPILSQNDNSMSVDTIASAVGISSAVAEKDLKEICQKMIIPNVYYDAGNRAVVRRGYKTPVPVQTQAKETQAPVQAEKAVAKCIGCNAPLSGFKGQIVKCEYCDSEQKL
jgi:hypothetical protein